MPATEKTHASSELHHVPTTSSLSDSYSLHGSVSSGHSEFQFENVHDVGHSESLFTGSISHSNSEIQCNKDFSESVLDSDDSDCDAIEMDQEKNIQNEEENMNNFINNHDTFHLEDLLKELQDDFLPTCNNENENDDLDDDLGSNEFESTDPDEVTDGEEPIYPGHFLSLKTSVLMIWMYIITCSLTASQVSGLLQLINLLLMVSHPALKSYYKFKQVFKFIQSPIVKHYYCSFCFAPVCDDDPDRAL